GFSYRPLSCRSLLPPHLAQRRNRSEAHGSQTIRATTASDDPPSSRRLSRNGRSGRERTHSRCLLDRANYRHCPGRNFLMTVLIGALTIGALLSLLALGVYITFRIFAFPDITAEGSITLGACITATLLVTEPTPLRPALIAAGATGLAVAAGLVWLRLEDGKSLGALITTGLVVGVIAAGTSVLILHYRNPVLATLAGFLGGLLAGSITGVLHTRFKINGLLSGILVMTALFSINLHVLGKSNVSLQTTTTLADYAGNVATSISDGRTVVRLAGWDISTREAGILLLGFVVIVLIGIVLYAFFRTALGTAMRATGDNSQMIRALGVN